MNGVNLNGSRVVRKDNIAFVVLPRDAWRVIEGGCGCRYCATNPRQPESAFWDTLAVPADGLAYTVHAPEFHATKPKRGTSA